MNRIFLFLAIIVSISSFSQDVKQQPAPEPYHHLARLAGIYPLGEFGETHHLGLDIAYRYSKKGFGRFEVPRKTKTGFVFGGGLHWFNGRDEMEFYSYDYGDYLLAYGMGGLQYSIGKSASLTAGAGPALSRYRSTNRFNLYGEMDFVYFPHSRWGANAGIRVLKENKAAWLSTVHLGVAFAF